MEFILASASPRRQELLKWVVPKFQVHPSTGEETVPHGYPTADIAELLAAAKADEVAQRFPDAVVIGCDTVVAFGRTVLGKPRDGVECSAMLQCLSGQKHTVYTGVCIRYGTKERRFTSSADVWFYPLTEFEIDRYIASGEPFDKAGGYGIQSLGSLLVEKIEGDYYAIVGLPVARLKRELTEFCREEGYAL